MKKLLLFILLFISLDSLSAQEGFFERNPLTITLFNHSIGVPFKDYFKKPLNIGIAIGTEFTYQRRDIHSTHQSLQIGWYHHKNLGSGLFLKSDLIQRFYVYNEAWTEISVSGGYFHSFSISDVYQLNKAGIYQKVKDKGTPAFLVGGGIGVGTRIDAFTRWQPAPFVKYEVLLETPYTSFVPVMPHILLEVGSLNYLNF